MTDFVILTLRLHTHRVVVGHDGRSAYMRIEAPMPTPGGGEAWREIVTLPLSRSEARIASAALRHMAENPPERHAEGPATEPPKPEEDKC